MEAGPSGPAFFATPNVVRVAIERCRKAIRFDSRLRRAWDISNPKILRCCYKNAAQQRLVANAGLIHNRGAPRAPFRCFFVGGPTASCQLPIIGRQRRRPAGTLRVVARLAGRERIGLTRKSNDSLVTERSDSHELRRTRSGTGRQPIAWTAIASADAGRDDEEFSRCGRPPKGGRPNRRRTVTARAKTHRFAGC